MPFLKNLEPGSKVVRKISVGVLLSICLALIFFILRAEIIGACLEPFLELRLKSVMGLKVKISGLAVDPFTGKVSARQVFIQNPKDFTKRPHIRTGFETIVDLKALREKRLVLGGLILRQPYFLIERNSALEPSILNIKTWIRHARERNEGKPKQDEDEKPQGWRITIPRGVIENGTFSYENLAGPVIRKQYFFQNLYGVIEGFDWPTKDPKILSENVRVKGTSGVGEPAPVWVRGKSNFSTYHLSFDLEGEITDGAVTDYRFLWRGLPLKVTSGRFDLKAHAVCDLRKLKWENDLVIKKLRLKSKKTASSLIWGLPLRSYVRFVESQESFTLKVPIEGNISGPDCSPEFRKAFQDSMNRYAQAGADFFALPVKKVAEPVGAVAEVPVKVMGETLSKVSTLMKGKEKKEEEAAPASASESAGPAEKV